jgi:hypothetical protein
VSRNKTDSDSVVCRFWTSSKVSAVILRDMQLHITQWRRAGEDGPQDGPRHVPVAKVVKLEGSDKYLHYHVCLDAIRYFNVEQDACRGLGYLRKPRKEAVNSVKSRPSRFA